jgi:hypothetical protein
VKRVYLFCFVIFKNKEIIYFSNFPSDGGILSFLANTTSVSPFKLNESLFSPSGSPGILNLPVLVLDVSDSQDAVI